MVAFTRISLLSSVTMVGSSLPSQRPRNTSIRICVSSLEVGIRGQRAHDVEALVSVPRETQLDPTHLPHPRVIFSHELTSIDTFHLFKRHLKGRHVDQALINAPQTFIAIEHNETSPLLHPLRTTSSSSSLPSGPLASYLTQMIPYLPPLCCSPRVPIRPFSPYRT